LWGFFYFGASTGSLRNLEVPGFDERAGKPFRTTAGRPQGEAHGCAECHPCLSAKTKRPANRRAFLFWSFDKELESPGSSIAYADPEPLSEFQHYPSHRIPTRTHVMVQPEIIATCSLLIRASARDAFKAFTDADTLTKFWLAKASDSLQLGTTVHWEFMVPGAKVDTRVAALEADERVLIEWSDGTFVEWTFESIDEGVVVTIKNWGFEGERDAALQSALEATQGFTLVLADLKTLLETGTSASIVKDKAFLIQRKR
jgi:uncharacterized protein YndB with AHSA1/START domain